MRVAALLAASSLTSMGSFATATPRRPKRTPGQKQARAVRVDSRPSSMVASTSHLQQQRSSTDFHQIRRATGHRPPSAPRSTSSMTMTRCTSAPGCMTASRSALRPSPTVTDRGSVPMIAWSSFWMRSTMAAWGIASNQSQCGTARCALSERHQLPAGLEHHLGCGGRHRRQKLGRRARDSVQVPVL